MPNPSISISNYAAEKLYPVAGKNPCPGMVDFSRMPYLFDIMEDLMPDKAHEQPFRGLYETAIFPLMQAQLLLAAFLGGSEDVCPLSHRPDAAKKSIVDLPWLDTILTAVASVVISDSFMPQKYS